MKVNMLHGAEAKFWPRSGGSWRDPWPMYAALREHDPVHRVLPDGEPDNDYWVLSRYRDVYGAVRDPGSFSSAGGMTIRYDELDQLGMLGEARPFVMQDPPSHTEFRKMVSRGFTPGQVEAVEPDIREFVRERVTRLREAGSADIVDVLFKPLPTMVVAHYLGVPTVDRVRFDRWTDAIVDAAGLGDVVAGGQALGELVQYFSELIEYRRKAPADDSISHLVSAGLGQKPDDHAGMLSILGFAFTMITGGNDTTTGLLGGAVQLLTQHPRQRALLLEDLDRVPGAVEEFLRLTSPVQGLCRTTTHDVTIEGRTIPAGRKVMLAYAAANRDERVFGEDAEELNVLRSPRGILAFGHGNHHCLGAAAARLQARIALTELLTQCPDFTVDVDAVEYAPGFYVRRPTRVPFRVTA